MKPLTPGSVLVAGTRVDLTPGAVMTIGTIVVNVGVGAFVVFPYGGGRDETAAGQ